jgi:hypothetical protein
MAGGQSDSPVREERDTLARIAPKAGTVAGATSQDDERRITNRTRGVAATGWRSTIVHAGSNAARKPASV